jgi:hypothetical protein
MEEWGALGGFEPKRRWKEGENGGPTRCTTRRGGGGGPGSDFAIGGGPDASRAQMWRRLLGGMTGEVLGGGHMWEGKGHVGHGRRAWAGGLGPVRRNNILFDLFKNFSNRIESIQSKNSLPLHKKFKIKYGFEGN